MYVENVGRAKDSEQPVVVYKMDCFGTRVPNDLINDFPNAYQVFKQFVKTETLVPGEILPVFTNGKTVIMAFTKFVSRFDEEPKDVDVALANIAFHLMAHNQPGVAFQDFNDIDSYVDSYYAGLSVESWSSTSASTISTSPMSVK